MLKAIRFALSLAVVVLLGACASQDSTDVRSACPAGLTVYCETYHGKPQRCFCASRADLENVLEPRQEPY